MTARNGIGTCWVCALLAWAALPAGCDRRYVIAGEDARLATRDLASRGRAEVPARDEEGRAVIIWVRADDDLYLADDSGSREVTATDRQALEVAKEVTLYYDRLADDLLVDGLAALVPTLISSVILGVVYEEWPLAMPVAGPWYGVVRSVQKRNSPSDETGGTIGTLGAILGALQGLVQLTGLTLVIYAGVTWDEGREVEGRGAVQGVTFCPISFEEGGLGGSLVFSF